jgi:hypothetical protein
MIKLVTFLAILLTTFTTSFAKRDIDATDHVQYGAGLSQINTGTGYGTGYAISASVLKGRRSLDFGIIYSERESKFSGGDFKYKIFLGNMDRIADADKLYKGYLQYNLLYQRGLSYGPDLIDLGGTSYEVPADQGTVISIGHFLAYGNRIRLFGNSFIDSSLGFGIYTGTFDNSDRLGNWAIQGTDSYFTYSFKIGLGYSFN